MQYALVITSSARHDLLQRTISSFLACADIQPRQIIVVEDGSLARPEWFPRHNVTWLSNGGQRGQIYSIDRAYDEVKCDYIFHCEDDWQFIQSSFLSESLARLSDPSVIQVSVRNDAPALSSLTSEWQQVDGGFSFNPSLKRLSDYKRISSYGRHVGYEPCDYSAELKLAQLYDKLGYSGIRLPYYCHHIGDTRHVPRTTRLPRVLIAVPTADVLDYSAVRKWQLERYGREWANGVSGLQYDGPNPRKQAVLDTWARDAAVFSNITVKLFTGSELGCGDSFIEVPEKNKRIARWALANGYERAFRCDDDTYCYMDRVARQAIEYQGEYGGVDCGGLLIGGSGIWLGKRALEIVANGTIQQGEWRDDAYICQALAEHGIRMGNDLPGLASVEGRSCDKPVTLHPVSVERMYQLDATSRTLFHTPL